MSEFSLPIPEELVDALAERVADRLAERLPSPTVAEPYIDAEGAAEYMACSTDRVYELKAQGRIPYWPDGRRILFKRSCLDAYLEGTEDASDSPNKDGGFA
jgi:excisionase family DNA binding protein